MKKILSALIVAVLLLSAILLVACVNKVPEGHVHAYTSNVVKPTCSTEGYTEHTCLDCGDYYRDTITKVEPKNHLMGEWGHDDSVVPNCTVKEMFRRDCEYCDYYETANEYSYKDKNGKTQKVTGTVKHTYHEELRICVPATCTADAYYIYECLYCGNIIEDKAGTYFGKPAQTKLGHDHTVVREIVAECGVDENGTPYEVYGVVEYSDCSRCGAEKAPVYTNPHTLKEDLSKDKLDPTCEKAGYTTHVCETCGTEVKIYTEAKHSWGAWSEPTENADGISVIHRECSSCGAEEEQVVVTKK